MTHKTTTNDQASTDYWVFAWKPTKSFIIYHCFDII